MKRSGWTKNDSPRARWIKGMLATFCLSAVGCMADPQNGQKLASTGDNFTFDGYLSGTNPQLVFLDVWNFQTNAYSAAAAGTAVSSPNAQVDGKGNTWYSFTSPAHIGATPAFWRQTVGKREVTAFVKGRPQSGPDLVSFDLGKNADGTLTATGQCVQTYANSGLDIMNHCTSSQSPQVMLTAACGTLNSIECPKNLGAASCPSGQNCDPCLSGLAPHKGSCMRPVWPASYTFSGANPGGPPANEWAVDWTNYLQGVAHDSANWYFTNQWGIYLVPLNADFGQYGDWLWSSATADDLSFNGQSGGSFGKHFHYGDPDFYGGHLFVPVEVDGVGRFLAVFGGAANYTQHLPVVSLRQMPAAHTNFAWLAINPEDGLMYASTKFDPVSEISVYKLDSTFTPTLYRTLTLSRTLHNVQGAAFSKSGHLYINSAPYDDSHGIYRVETDGSVQGVIPYQLSYAKTSDGFASWYDEEGEGMDILDNSGQPGQIHMAKINFYASSNDGMIFYHWTASGGSY
jgi:hypothetical protein